MKAGRTKIADFCPELPDLTQLKHLCPEKSLEVFYGFYKLNTAF